MRIKSKKLQQQIKNIEPHRFPKGKSGNPGGRPKGGRNMLSERFLKDLHEDWEEHGKEVLAAARAESPAAYMKVVAALIPKEMHHRHFLDDLKELSTEELKQKLEQVRQERMRLEGEAPEETRH